MCVHGLKLHRVTLSSSRVCLPDACFVHVQQLADRDAHGPCSS